MNTTITFAASLSFLISFSIQSFVIQSGFHSCRCRRRIRLPRRLPSWPNLAVASKRRRSGARESKRRRSISLSRNRKLDFYLEKQQLNHESNGSNELTPKKSMSDPIEQKQHKKTYRNR